MDTKEEFKFEDERLRHFVNRDTQLARAREIITGPAGESLPVIVFCGSGGMGKTSLLHKIRLDICLGGQEAGVGVEGLGQIPYALVDFAAAGQGTRSRAGMLGFIKRELAAYGLEFPRFELVWARYGELLSEQAFQSTTASASEYGAIIEAARSVGGAFESVADLLNLLEKNGIAWYTKWRGGRLTPKGIESWEHAGQAAEALAQALAADMLAAYGPADLYQRYAGYRWPVLMFDSIEWLEEAGEERGLTLEAIRELCEYLLQVPIIIGRSGEVEWHNAIGERPVEQYADADRCDGEAVANDDGPERDDLVDRVLEEAGEGMRDLVRAACVCRWFDRELLRAVAGTTGTLMDEFKRLRGFSFVEPVAWDDNSEPTRWAIHQEVREATLAELREEGLLKEFAARGAEYCEAKGEEWIAERTYFLMMSEREAGIVFCCAIFDYVNISANWELGLNVLQAGRDGWWAAHRGESKEVPEPWNFSQWEGDMAGRLGELRSALEVYERALARAKEQEDSRGRSGTGTGRARRSATWGCY